MSPLTHVEDIIALVFQYMIKCVICACPIARMTQRSVFSSNAPIGRTKLLFCVFQKNKALQHTVLLDLGPKTWLDLGRS